MIHLVSAQNYTKTNISNSLIQTRTCEYHGVRNINFSENVMCVLNEWSKKEIIQMIDIYFRKNIFSVFCLIFWVCYVLLCIAKNK